MAAPNTAAAIAAGGHLHLALLSVCQHLVGVDSDLSARSLLPPDDERHEIISGDVTAPGDLARAIAGRPFDAIVAGEILEHLLNPGLCLTTLAAQLPAATLIVSVPNALSHAVATDARRGVETVHANHVCWYSPRTLRHLLEITGWTRTTIYALGKPGKRYGLGNAACPSILAESRTA